MRPALSGGRDLGPHPIRGPALCAAPGDAPRHPGMSRGGGAQARGGPLAGGGQPAAAPLVRCGCSRVFWASFALLGVRNKKKPGHKARG